MSSFYEEDEASADPTSATIRRGSHFGLLWLWTLSVLLLASLSVGCGGPASTPTAATVPSVPDTDDTAPQVLFYDLDYANWSRFPVGTQVKRKSVTSSPKATASTTSVETLTLKEVTDGAVVVVRQNTTQRSDGSYHVVNPPEERKYPRSFAIPSGMTAEDFSKPSRGARKDGEETGTVAGTSYRAVVYTWEDQTESGKMSVRVWLSDDIPGRIVKQEMKVPALENTTSDEVIEVKKP